MAPTAIVVINAPGTPWPVQSNTASMQPPRALWVTFPLGRPLGSPGDAEFQHRVIAASLDLLNRPAGPVLEDYLEDAPLIEVESAAACPVSFTKPTIESDTWKARFLNELNLLRPWHDLGRRRRKGRTLVGVSGFSTADNLEKLGNMLDADELPVSELDWFKLAIEDAKVFYLEALTAQPGDHAHQQIQHIFWQETQLGAGLVKFYKMFQASEKHSLFARIVVPREAIETGIELQRSSHRDQT